LSPSIRICTIEYGDATACAVSEDDGPRKNGSCYFPNRLQCAWGQPAGWQIGFGRHRAEFDRIRRSAGSPAGHDTTAHIVEDWNKGNDNFAKDPPNATVSAFTKDGSGVMDAVVVLKSPNLEADKLTFDIDVLEGDLNGADGAAAEFIDIIGRPFSPMSFAGVARRTAFHSAMYAGAAGAAVAAGAYALPACGYYPYPPCY
jgi:hypothetical protein